MRKLWSESRGNERNDFYSKVTDGREVITEIIQFVVPFIKRTALYKSLINLLNNSRA